MSTLPGGPADKAGLNHEALWGVLGMAQILTGEADCIRIEEPGTDGAEFYLERGGTREHWQAKRQILSQQIWTLRLLAREGVLGFFQERINAGEACVFASISDAPDLRCLAERAKEAHNLEEFQVQFLSAEKWKKSFDELRQHLGNSSEAKAFEYLKNVRVETATESTIEDFLIPILKAYISGSPQTAMVLLRDFYTQSVHKRLTAENIWNYLKSHCIQPRTFPVCAEVRDFLHGITEAYIAGQRSNLIRHESIPRQVAKDIATNIEESDLSLDVLITAPAGGGKSAALLQVVEHLRKGSTPVLAFRLDRVEPVASTEALGQKLNLPESPAIVLSQCYPEKAVVLVIDQIDCVSATSGRHPDFFEVVAALVEEIRGLRSLRRIHLVMACRQFDFEHDHRLRRLLPPAQNPLVVEGLSDEEIRNVVIADGGDPNNLSPAQIELLRLPQNLSLLIESGLSRESAPSFVTQKGLFDRYWDVKRRAVFARCGCDAALWKPIISKLTDEMSRREELSVSMARLDEFPPEILVAMVTEGVLNLNEQRYGFGHESFFDYCFARNVAASGIEFVQFLEGDQQELFRRAQLRQVLVYLRDDDLQRYLSNIRLALASEKIRPHLKDLVLNLVSAFPDPRDEEFELLLPYLESELISRSNSEPNPNKVATRAWFAFFNSRTLFVVADRLSALKHWLNSGVDCVEDQIAGYLRWQSELHGDRVAELLEPFAGKDGHWKDRLRYIMEWARHGKSRRFFELFLQLLDDGTLDEARDRFASNGTFWSMFYDFGKNHPDWCAELTAHWIDRKVAIAKACVETGDEPSLHWLDDSGVDDLIDSATRAPKIFLEQVIPAILRASAAFAYPDDGTLVRDQIWPTRFPADYMGIVEAIPNACETAFKILAENDPCSLRSIISLLRESPLYTANHLLQNAFLSAPELFAEEAMIILADEPKRLQCGFSDSPYWIARTLIERCSHHCTAESFRKIEAAVLAYSSPYEHSKEGFRYRGHAAYTLSLALDPKRLSPEANSRLAEWKRKYPVPDEPPRGVRSYSVSSPIPQQAAEHMSDEQWLNAIAKYDTDRGTYDWNHPERGGACQLAGHFGTFLKSDPLRFTRLALRFPDAINSSYFMNVLYSLREVVIDSDLKIEVARRVFEFDDNACLRAALDLLATIKEFPLPEDAIRFICRMATEHPDPDSKNEGKDDLLTVGMNTVRGHGVGAIRDLVFCNSEYLQSFGATIAQCANDPSVAVRSCVASTLLAVAVHNTPMAICLFTQLLQTDELILATRDVEDFLAKGLRLHITEFSPIIERMIGSKEEKVHQAGGRLACLARLYHSSLDNLSEAALTGDSACRLGAAEIAKQNLTNKECRGWCEMALRRLFHDSDQKIRQKAANCFWHLWKHSELPLTDYDGLIRAFLDSPSFDDEPTYLLHALSDTRHRVPETILDVCDTFVSRCAEQARDIRTSISGDLRIVGELVFRAYAQLEKQPLRKRALNLIDAMCIEGLHDVGKHLTEFDR